MSKDYDPPLSTRLRWVFIGCCVLAIVVLVGMFIASMLEDANGAVREHPPAERMATWEGDGDDIGGFADDNVELEQVPLTAAETAEMIRARPPSGQWACNAWNYRGQVEAASGTDLVRGYQHAVFCNHHGRVFNQEHTARTEITNWGEPLGWTGWVIGKDYDCVDRDRQGDCVRGVYVARWKAVHEIPGPIPDNVEYMRLRMNCHWLTSGRSECRGDSHYYG